MPYGKLLDSVEKSIRDERYGDLKNLKQIDRVTVNMEWDVNSVMYHFIPVKYSNRLMTYHQGHDDEFK